MTTTYYKVSVKIADVDADLAKAYTEAQKAVTEAAKALIAAYQKSPRYAAALDLSANTSYHGKQHPAIQVQGFELVYSIPVTTDAKAQQSPTLYLGEKTINTLLNGKILSDDEKRKLIENVTQGVISASVEAEE